MHTVTVHYMYLPNLDFTFFHECVDLNVLVNASCSIQVGCPYSFLYSWHESGSWYNHLLHFMLTDVVEISQEVRCRK